MVKVDFQLLILSWIEVVAVFTLETTTQWTILWRPFIVPGLYYEKLESSNSQPDFMKGSKCLDMCEDAFFHGPRICRYLMIEPLQADWDKPITQTMDFVDRVRDMRVKNCYLFEAQRIEEDLAKKFFISKGFRNPFNNEQGTHITLEFVAEVYQSWLWPNPFADVVVPDHFEMDTRATRYFEKTGTCPWNSGMISQKTESTSTTTTAEDSTTHTTTREKQSTVSLYSMICGEDAAHSFDTAECPDRSDTPTIIYESEFSREQLTNCNMIPYMIFRGTMVSAANTPTNAEGWCSSQRSCGFDTPLYISYHTSSVGFKITKIYVSTPDAVGTVVCYAKSSTKKIESFA